jgi:phospholipase C
MQENRSFDHYFGFLSGVLGFDDRKPLRLPDGRPVFYQPDPANPQGCLLPCQHQDLLGPGDPLDQPRMGGPARRPGTAA